MFGPRGVLRCKATDNDDPTEHPAAAASASRRSRTPARSTKKRMETIDDETSDAAIDFIERQAKAGKPFFCWFNSTRMHLRPTSRPTAGARRA